jgi:hypothetical protein
MLRQGGTKARSAVRVVKVGGQLQVWFCPRYQPRVLAGAIGVGLAEDALRYGQDLLGELIDKALWMADRRSSVTKVAKAPAG